MAVKPSRTAGRVTLTLVVSVLAITPRTALAVNGDRTIRWDRVVMPAATAAALRRAAIPGFSRQTGLPCAACHNQFPELNAFGRMFKLNGYTLTTLSTIRARESDTTRRETLALLPIPPLSAMMVASYSTLRAAIPGTQNGTARFPQQASIFIGGVVTPKIGVFSQFTYAAADGSFGIDNVDVRYADHARLNGEDLLYGLTLNNNPTVQDVWNTVPAWNFPFMTSDVAPQPAAATLIEGGLGQQVLGLGAFALWHGALYAELAAYRSAPQGTAGQLDSSAVTTASGMIPYWRVTLQHQFDAGALMLGTFGLRASIHPTGITGPTNRHTDVGVDAQFEHPLADGGAVILRGDVIHESRRLDAFVAESPPAAANAENTLTTMKLNATYQPSVRYGITGGVFGASGTVDTLLYAPGSVGGSGTGNPATRGYVAELAVNLWQNVRAAAQYVGYTRFNGAGSNYDGEGRNAADNGTLTIYLWLAY